MVESNDFDTATDIKLKTVAGKTVMLTVPICRKDAKRTYALMMKKAKALLNIGIDQFVIAEIPGIDQGLAQRIMRLHKTTKMAMNKPIDAGE